MFPLLCNSVLQQEGDGDAEAVVKTAPECPSPGRRTGSEMFFFVRFASGGTGEAFGAFSPVWPYKCFSKERHKGALHWSTIDPEEPRGTYPLAGARSCGAGLLCEPSLPLGVSLAVTGF